MEELQIIDGLEGYVLDEITLPDDWRESLKSSGHEGNLNAERIAKMHAYFADLDVLVMDTSRGPFIVGSGPPEEVATVLDELSHEQKNKIILLLPGMHFVVGLEKKFGKK